MAALKNECNFQMNASPAYSELNVKDDPYNMTTDDKRALIRRRGSILNVKEVRRKTAEMSSSNAE